MMKTSEPAGTERPLISEMLYALHYYLGGRRGLVVLAAATVVTGLAFNWSWLVAVGFAPLLVAVLPCLAMCALGLCMVRKAGGSGASEGKVTPTTIVSVPLADDDSDLALPAAAETLAGELPTETTSERS